MGLRLRKRGRPRKYPLHAVTGTPAELIDVTVGDLDAIGRSHGRGQGYRGRRGRARGNRNQSNHMESSSDVHDNVMDIDDHDVSASDATQDTPPLPSSRDTLSLPVGTTTSSTSGDRPPSSGDRPPSTGDRPPSSGDRPPSACSPVSVIVCPEPEDPLAGLSSHEKVTSEADTVGPCREEEAEKEVPASIAPSVTEDGDNDRGKETQGSNSCESRDKSTITGPSAAVVMGTEESPIAIDDTCPDSEPSGAKPSGAKPSGAEPSGAKPSGAEPSGQEQAERKHENTESSTGPKSDESRQSSNEVLDKQPRPLSTDRELEKVSTPIRGERESEGSSTPPVPPPSSSVPQTPTDTTTGVSSPRATPVGILKHTSQFDTPSSASKVSAEGREGIGRHDLPAWISTGDVVV